MPSTLPTLASPPPPPAPEIRPKPARRTETPDPAFDRELSRKRQVEQDRRAAEAAERPDRDPDVTAAETPETARDEADTRPAGGGAAESRERDGGAQSPDREAQSVPSGAAKKDDDAGTATTVAGEILAALQNASSTRPVSVPADAEADGRQQPASSSDQAAPGNVTPPVFVTETTDRHPVTQTVSRVTEGAQPRPADAAVQPPPTPGGASATAVTAGPAPAPAATGDGGESQADGNNADARSQNMPGEARHAAMSRALQIQAGVHLQNLTGQGPVQDLTGAGRVTTQAATTGGETQTPLPSAISPESDANPTTARVLRGLSAVINQRGGVMSMRLDPPDLGQLRIQMTIARGVVTAQFQATTAEAQALLDRSLATLRTALESHGLTVERLTVHATQAPGSQGMREHASDEQSPQQRDHGDAGDGRSRGRNDDPNGEEPHRFASMFDDEFQMPDATGAPGAEAA